MNQLQLKNGTTYELATNGVVENGDMIKYIIVPGSNSFDSIETNFKDSTKTETIHVLGNDLDPIRSIVGFTKYKGMEKIVEYVLSSEMVNNGTEEEPDYQESVTTGTVMIVTMSKPELEDRVTILESDVINTMLALTELYEGSI